MEKITISYRLTEKYDYRIATFFYAWLMDKVDVNFAESLHQTGINPISISAYKDIGTGYLEINLLTQEAIDQVADILLDEDFKSFELRSTDQKRYEVTDKKVESLTQEQLAKIFYLTDSDRVFRVYLQVSTAFKTEGYYYNLPDVRLFFQSLMLKYNAIFEQTEKIDTDLLDEICRTVQIAGFNIRSQRFYLHKAYINGFLGKVTFISHGNQTLTNYINMLLKFGEYSGVGVKTSLGMGSFKLMMESKNE